MPYLRYPLYNYGTNLTFTITPDTFYHILDVQVDGVSVGGVSTYSFTNITSDHTITAMFEQDPPSQVAQTIENIITSLPSSAFSNPNNQNALLNKMNAIINIINGGDYGGAIHSLTNDVLAKTDGCDNSGTPDNNDWITTCDAQERLYSAILYLTNQLKGM